MFAECTSLASVDLPEGVTNIDENVFSGCTSLAGIILPASLNSLGENAFSDCASLASVTFNSDFRSAGYFSDAGVFPGDLRTKYLAEGDAGGIGTYTRSPPEDTWTKQ
jgi:hypothetical protein